MSTQMASTRADSAPDGFPSREWVHDATEMDADEFAELPQNKQMHVLWEQVREIPFKYAKHSCHGKMRRFLAGAVVKRCKTPTVLFETFPRIREFRQNKGRAECVYYGRESKLRVDFHTYSASSDYGVTEASVQHELLHAMLRANDIRMPKKAFYRGDGRTDRAYFYNGGFPNWDFGGKDVPADTYLHRDYDDTPVVSDAVLEDMLDKRLAAYDESGLYEGADNDHALDGRADPFADDVSVPTPDDGREAFLMLVGEANIAWYTTAKAFSQGYEEVARHSYFWDEYTATNPDEFLCKLHEFLQNPGAYSGTYATVAEARHRHPWLLKRYLDCFEPHPDKQDAVESMIAE